MATLRAGLLSSKHDRESQILWNEMFRRTGDDAFFDVYRTESCTCPRCEKKTCLTLRLSEMFLLGRRGYIIHDTFQASILPLLDELDETAKQSGRASIVLNDQGILTGYHVGEGERQIADLYALLTGKPLPEDMYEKMTSKIAG